MSAPLLPSAAGGLAATIYLPIHIHVLRIVTGIRSIPKPSPDNWVKLSAKGQLKDSGDKPVSAEQMELARVTMERVILKKATAYFARESL